MNINPKKLILIALIAGLLVVSIVLVLLVSASASRKALSDTSKEYKNITTTNGLTKEDSYKKEDSPDDSIENINKASGLIKNLVIAKYKIIKSDVSPEEREFVEIENKIKNKKYSKALSSTKASIDKLNEAIREHNKRADDEFQEISKELIDKYSGGKAIVVNQKLSGDWAILTLAAPDGTGYAASTVIKKENGKWKVILPPGSMFTKEQLAGLESAGAPKDLYENANLKYRKDILTPLKY